MNDMLPQKHSEASFECPAQTTVSSTTSTEPDDLEPLPESLLENGINELSANSAVLVVTKVNPDKENDPIEKTDKAVSSSTQIQGTCFELCPLTVCG